MNFNDLSADCLYYFVSRAYLASTSLLKKELLARGAGDVKPAYLGVLMTLWENDGLQASELGRKAGLEPSSMTGMIDRMERDGLITRQSDPNDRRALRIYLTDKGKSVQKPVMGVVDKALASVFENITDDEMEQTKKVLRTFIENIQARRNRPENSQ